MKGVSASLSLIAKNLYNQVASKDFGANIEVGSLNKGVSFTKELQNSFNIYSQMTPEQILAHISKRPLAVSPNNALGEGFSISKPLRRNEHVISKQLLSEASLLELGTTNLKVQNTIRSIVTLRDQCIQAWEKIMSMQF